MINLLNLNFSHLEIVFIFFAVALIVYYFRNSLKKIFSPSESKYETIEDKYNSEKRNREKEIDRLLGKMGKNGVIDLSEKDRKRLNELSKK